MKARRIISTLVATAVLAVAGGGTAVWLAGGTQGTAVACATATAQAQTLADNGTPVVTVPSETAANCTTVTYTVPTATVTTGESPSTQTTTTQATTTVATTTQGSTPTYASEIAYASALPAFTPTRTVNVTTAAGLKAALANLQAGDLVKATAPFTITVGGSADALTISSRLSSYAELDLTGVSILYTGGQNYDGVWLKNPSHIRILGGDISTDDTGGACISLQGGTYLTWYGFTAHDCGGTGFGASGAFAPTEHDDIQGTITKVGQNLAWDPHAEKGTGEHCVNLDDKNNYPFDSNRFAFYCHDIPTGAGVEYGASIAANPPVSNTLVVKCVNLTEVATIQTGGNCLQFWGVNGQQLDVKYLEVSNAEGYALWDGGMNSGATLPGVKVEYGTATGTNKNSRYAGQNPWSDRLGEVYEQVTPAASPGKP